MTLRKIILISFLVEVAIAVMAVINDGMTLEALQTTTRFSARFSLVIFSAMFLWWPFGQEKLTSLLSPKPFHVFAFVHGIHLLELLTYVYLSDANLIPIRLVGGFVAYIFIFLMPVLHILSNNGKITPERFSLSANIYLYYVWFIFFMSYLPRIQGKLPQAGGTYIEWLVLFIWVCMLLLTRFIFLLQARRKNYA